MCLEVGHDLAPWILVKVGSLVLPAGISPITVLKPEPQTQRPTCSASRFLDPRVGHGGDHRLSFQDGLKSSGSQTLLRCLQTGLCRSAVYPVLHSSSLLETGGQQVTPTGTRGLGDVGESW
ncbi:hypothetical protein GN956_G18214 [Arapaima gigas]